MSTFNLKVQYTVSTSNISEEAHRQYSSFLLRV